MIEGLEPRQMFNVVNVPDITVPVGSANATFTATVQGAVRSPITLKFFAVDGTAHGKRDFVYTKSTVTISPGSDTATFAIPLLNDPVFARLRQFKVHVDVEGSDGPGINATCNIEAAAPTLSLQAATYVSAKGLPNPTTVQGPYVLPNPKAQQSFILTFSLSRASGNPTTFNFTANDGAIPADDSDTFGLGLGSGLGTGAASGSDTGSATTIDSSHNTDNDAVAQAGIDYVVPTVKGVTFKPGQTTAKVKITLLPNATKTGKRRDFNLVISNLKGAIFSTLLSSLTPRDSTNVGGVNVFIGLHDNKGKPVAGDVPAAVNQIVV